MFRILRVCTPFFEQLGANLTSRRNFSFFIFIFLFWHCCLRPIDVGYVGLEMFS